MSKYGRVYACLNPLSPSKPTIKSKGQPALEKVTVTRKAILNFAKNIFTTHPDRLLDQWRITYVI